MPDKSLSDGIRRLVKELRSELGPYGWTVHVETSVGHELSVVFGNRLSSVSHGFGFDPDKRTSEVRRQLRDALEAVPEIARTKLAKPPRRRRNLVGALRWAATTYGWSDRVFREIVETLSAAEVLSSDEAEWMRIVGPTHLDEKVARQWRKHVRAEQRRTNAREERTTVSGADRKPMTNPELKAGRAGEI